MNYLLFHARTARTDTEFVPCVDGIVAAAIAKHHFDSFEPGEFPPYKIIPCNYTKTPDLEIVPDETFITLVDIAYPPRVIEAWTNQGAHVMVIDHHEKAIRRLQGRTLAETGRFDSVFDIKKSGASLAWEVFCPDSPTPDLVRLVQDYDLWTKQIPGVDEVHFGITTKLSGLTMDEALQKVERWLFADDYPWIAKEHLLDLFITGVGSPEMRSIKPALARCATKRQWRLVAGRAVPFLKLKGYAERTAYSIIAHELLKKFSDAPFVCVEVGGGWALRSEDRREDVSTIAEMLGGGGHRNAAGCRKG